MPRGLIGEPFSPLPGCTAFYFRVSRAGASFDIALGTHKSVHPAYESIKRLYPGATITVLQEKEFDSDGLPRVNVRQHREKIDT